jgi:hypothetical protein
MKISDEAVEAVALALFADEHCDKRQMQDVRGNWDARLNDEDQALYRSMARAALEAARPYLERSDSEEQVAEPSPCLGDGVCTNPKCPVHGIKEEPSDQPS